MWPAGLWIEAEGGGVMEMLSADLLDKVETSAASLRDVVEHMRKLGALVEIVGHVIVEAPTERYDGTTAEELILEAGSLLERLGGRARELLAAQSAPMAPTPIRQPRERTARRRTA
jgi:hypothetical protein